MGSCLGIPSRYDQPPTGGEKSPPQGTGAVTGAFIGVVTGAVTGATTGFTTGAVVLGFAAAPRNISVNTASAINSSLIIFSSICYSPPLVVSKRLAGGGPVAVTARSPTATEIPAPAFWFWRFSGTNFEGIFRPEMQANTANRVSEHVRSDTLFAVFA